MSKRSPLALVHPASAEWFRSALGEPTRAQALGWPPIARGESALLLAPTGSGKTLAAFFFAIDRLVWSPEPPKLERTKVLYVSPLKALAVDIERNLRAPLAGIAATAAQHGTPARTVEVGVRTGDTPAAERARFLRTPPDVLITTPESLYLMLTSKAKEILRSVDLVILDEIHQLVPTKRGAHLVLSLERLEALRGKKRPPLQRVGLSATQRPLDEVARLLGGFEDGAPRPVTIVDAGDRKPLELRVEVPEVDLSHEHDVEPIPSGPAAGGPKKKSLWPDLHARIVEHIRAHRSTIVFVNSRRLAERLAGALNELAGEELALAHHGSVSREKRSAIEDRLKKGEVRAIVATSSLELGIDMGAVDLVVQVEAPPSVAAGLQRIGRASHHVGGVPSGVVLPKHRGDLLASAAIAKRMREGLVEETFYPRNPLDVLAQHIVAMACEGDVAVDALYALVRRAAPFSELPRSAFEGVLDMLSGRYPSTEFAELRARITWDRVGGKVRAREGAMRLAITNGGTIPDRGLYGVFLMDDGRSEKKGGRRVGELDEEMVFELSEGEVFVLGASSWRAEEITLDRVLVSPAAGQPGKMPFWHGDRAGRPRVCGEAIGHLARTLSRLAPSPAEALLIDEHALDASAARNLGAYVRAQLEATDEVPSDKAVLVERFIDELGDWRVCVLTPFGTRVIAPWATVVRERLRARYAGEIDVVYTDDGMAFRIPACDEPPPADLFFPPSEEIADLVTAALADTSLFAARFRENAGRALLLPKRHPTKRTPLWAQRKRASDLLSVASRHPEFPILLETYRECLRDVFDLPGLVEVLRGVESRKIRVSTADTRTASPFASNVLFSYVASFLYDGDAPLAERRAQALTIDHAQLRELLGETELRKLLDADVLDEHERTLQRLEHPARSADALHDLLRLLGDLSREEVEARVDPPTAARAWLDALVVERRVVAVKIAKQVRYAAAEDAGRFRDALGIVPPRGLPAAFLEATARPLSDLVARYARTHGPFTASDVAKRFGLGVVPIDQALAELARDGRVVGGEFLPHGTTREHCDVEVLASLRRKSLARIRRAVEPVDGAAYARFLVDWSGVGQKRRGPDALLASITQLEGAPLVASALETDVLPARVDEYRAWDLDRLCASGTIVWCGLEPIGPNDGRIALFVADHEPLLAPPSTPVPGAIAETIRALLARRGAVFFAEIARETGGFPTDALEALWDMVWAGEVTNDTLEPLRSRLRAAPRTPSRRRREPNGRSARTGAPPGSEGRWSLRASRWGREVAETERRAATARTLLERHGVVMRETAHAEGLEGGFSAVYAVLQAMEHAGRVRRGYFVAGRGGAQFALPGAEERLRARRDPSDDAAPLILAATDPASPFGASLPWPEARGGAKPQRAAGALVVLRDGELLAWIGRSEQTLLTFLPNDAGAFDVRARALATALYGLARAAGRRALLLSTIDGDDAARSHVAPYLLAAGFVASGRELLLRARDATRAASAGPVDARR